MNDGVDYFGVMSVVGVVGDIAAVDDLPVVSYPRFDCVFGRISMHLPIDSDHFPRGIVLHRDIVTRP